MCASGHRLFSDGTGVDFTSDIPHESEREAANRRHGGNSLHDAAVGRRGVGGDLVKNPWKYAHELMEEKKVTKKPHKETADEEEGAAIPQIKSHSRSAVNVPSSLPPKATRRLISPSPWRHKH